MKPGKMLRNAAAGICIVFISLFNPSMAGAQAAGVFNGDIMDVVKISYIKRIVMGSFTKADGNNWIEKNKTGTYTLQEKSYKHGVLRLVDTARNRQIMLNLNTKVTYSAKINKIGFYVGDGDITDIILADSNPQPTNDNKTTVQTTVPVSTNTQPVTPTVDNSKKVTDANTLDIPELVNKTPVYHAILIAENEYEDNTFNPLPGTVSDVRKMYELLTTKYTFDPANTDTLINASKLTIKRRINEVGKSLTENDNLFIFYAGHGWLKKYDDGSGRQEGFLIPTDAEKGDEVTFINNQDLITIIKRCNAKHILFTADACFAGALFRDIPSDAPLTVAEAYKDKSRKLLSSGNEQAVSDESDFVEYLRLALQENRARYITAGELVNSFKKGYIEKTHMKLQYVPIQNVDDMGGEFVFIRR